MKNPKWREAHPLNKKVKYNGKYLTTWSGYSMDLQQSPHGSATTTAKRFYEDDVVPFNITVDDKYRLKQLSAVSATVTGTSATVGDSNFTIKPIYEKYIFDLKLQQSTGGTISANKLTGTSGTNVSLSYTATGGTYFSSWSVTGGSITNNTFKFGNTDATAKGNFLNTNPLKLYNNATRIVMKDHSSYSGIDNKYLYLDGPIYATQSPNFLFANSGTIKNKNYFVLKYDMIRQCDLGNYTWYTTAWSDIFVRAAQSAADNLTCYFIPKIEKIVGTTRMNSLVGTTAHKFGYTYEPLYNNNGTITSTDITLPSNAIPGAAATWSAYKRPLKANGKHFNHGRIGTYQEIISANDIGKYIINVTATGKWNTNNYCFEPSAYNDGVWKPVKLVFDMNSFAYSSYIGSECVYKQTNIKHWFSSTTATTPTQMATKLYAIHTIQNRVNADWYTLFNGTSSTVRNVGWLSARNVSYTYFDTCEQANLWAKNN